ncbi:3',5'-cyclic-nucleotide phosphodiesterase [Spiribacter vilamensis]|nr:3',5'-cyclic-nucleotide phosphodiesterase [Spiribacter vilamensis]
MHIQTLGSSGGLESGNGTTAFHIAPATLIDAGTGSQRLERAQLDSLSDVLLTHAHADHIAGLPLLIDALFDTLTTTGRALNVHALPETIQSLRAHVFNNDIWPDFSRLPSARAGVLRFHPLTPWQPLSLAGEGDSRLTVTPFPVAHTVPTCGFCIDDTDTRTAICGDTGLSDVSIDALNRLAPLTDLYIECGLSNAHDRLAEQARHLTPDRLTRLLGALDVQPERVWITHLKPLQREAIIEMLRAQLPPSLCWALA